jgi:hypothetical protein
MPSRTGDYLVLLANRTTWSEDIRIEAYKDAITPELTY